MINSFINENLFKYAIKVLNYDNWSFEAFFDPMTKTFPKMAKCKYYDYGASGSPNVIDHLCVLPYNIYFEKIYLFIFFWFNLLLIVNIIHLIYRLLLSFSYQLRSITTSFNLQYVNKEKLSSIINSLTIGQWYILDVLSLNSDPVLFNCILNYLKVNVEQFKKDDNLTLFDYNFNGSEENVKQLEKDDNEISKTKQLVDDKESKKNLIDAQMQTV